MDVARRYALSARRRSGAHLDRVQQIPLRLNLREHSRFATFVDAGAEPLVALLRRFATGRASGAVWIAGPPASGRTHLLQAFCAASDAEGRRVGYLHMPTALRDGVTLESTAWTGLDALCLDDFEVAVGTSATERPLFGLYRDFEERNAALIVAAAQPPGALRWSLPDLASRFAACALHVLHPLDEPGQLEALRRHARARGLDLPDDVARYLQRRSPRDMRAVADLLGRLDTAALQAQRRLTVPFVREVLGSATDD